MGQDGLVESLPRMVLSYRERMLGVSAEYWRVII